MVRVKRVGLVPTEEFRRGKSLRGCAGAAGFDEPARVRVGNAKGLDQSVKNFASRRRSSARGPQRGNLRRCLFIAETVLGEPPHQLTADLFGRARRIDVGRGPAGGEISEDDNRESRATTVVAATAC